MRPFSLALVSLLVLAPAAAGLAESPVPLPHPTCPPKFDQRTGSVFFTFLGVRDPVVASASYPAWWAFLSHYDLYDGKCLETSYVCDLYVGDGSTFTATWVSGEWALRGDYKGLPVTDGTMDCTSGGVTLDADVAFVLPLQGRGTTRSASDMVDEVKEIILIMD
jgi:hypothetical protein